MLVVELTGSASVAAGPPSHDLTGIMRELGADAERLNLWRAIRPQPSPRCRRSPIVVP